MFLMKYEVLQEIPRVYATPGEKTTWGWLQEAQEDLEEVSERFSIPEGH